MKIKIEDYEVLKKAAQEVKNDNPKVTPESYEVLYKKDKKVKDINKRFRWDLFYAGKKYIGGGTNANAFIHKLYEYLNDDHIDTALKKIVAELYN